MQLDSRTVRIAGLGFCFVAVVIASALARRLPVALGFCAVGSLTLALHGIPSSYFRLPLLIFSLVASLCVLVMLGLIVFRIP